MHSALNTARAFATVHDAGQVVGDVNHSNLMISRSATVAMIDCNSFQITEGVKTFNCKVATPEFTPHELQGKDLASQKRTTQHDAFGMSVLIFYLLFLGRHPFMGVFDPKANDMLSPEEALGKYKFPYALSEQSPEVRLPPFVPRLTDYPAQIGELFKRAFTVETQQRGRPTAQEGVTALSALSSATKQCGNNPNHHYFSGLAKCPWCRVEGVIGAAIFGVRITTILDHKFDLIAVWAQIDAITTAAEVLEKPNVKHLQAQFSPDPQLSPIIKRRRLFRSISVAVFLAASIVAEEELIPIAAILVIVGALFVSKKLWVRGGEPAKPFYERCAQASDSHKQAEEQFEMANAAPAKFVTEKQKLLAQ